MIAVATNPLDDIRILGDASQISMVWKGGQLVKSPGDGAAVYG